MKQKKLNGKERGITLIALVVTIIILIILATISISAVLGENGIIASAIRAKDEHIKSEEEENAMVQDWLTKINEYEGGNNPGDIPEELPKAEDVLKAGDYVNYIDKYGTAQRCIVLWDTSSKYKNVQIVTEDILKYSDGEYVEIVIDNKDGTGHAAVALYNNWITTLNGTVEDFMNEEYSFDARCLGADPDDKDDKSGFLDDVFGYLSSFPGGGVKNSMSGSAHLFNDEANQLDRVGAYSTPFNRFYWVAYRGSATYDEFLTLVSLNACFEMYAGDGLSVTNFANLYIYPSGEFWLERNTLDEQGGIVKEISAGIRGIFYLNPDVKVLSGDGTSEEPYNLTNEK